MRLFQGLSPDKKHFDCIFFISGTPLAVRRFIYFFWNKVFWLHMIFVRQPTEDPSWHEDGKRHCQIPSCWSESREGLNDGVRCPCWFVAPPFLVAEFEGKPSNLRSPYCKIDLWLLAFAVAGIVENIVGMPATFVFERCDRYGPWTTKTRCAVSKSSICHIHLFPVQVQNGEGTFPIHQGVLDHLGVSDHSSSVGAMAWGPGMAATSTISMWTISTWWWCDFPGELQVQGAEAWEHGLAALHAPLRAVRLQRDHPHPTYGVSDGPQGVWNGVALCWSCSSGAGRLQWRACVLHSWPLDRRKGSWWGRFLFWICWEPFYLCCWHLRLHFFKWTQRQAQDAFMKRAISEKIIEGSTIINLKFKGEIITYLNRTATLVDFTVDLETFVEDRKAHEHKEQMKLERQLYQVQPRRRGVPKAAASKPKPKPKATPASKPKPKPKATAVSKTKPKAKPKVKALKRPAAAKWFPEPDGWKKICLFPALRLKRYVRWDCDFYFPCACSRR